MHMHGQDRSIPYSKPAASEAERKATTMTRTKNNNRYVEYQIIRIDGTHACPPAGHSLTGMHAHHQGTYVLLVQRRPLHAFVEAEPVAPGGLQVAVAEAEPDASHALGAAGSAEAAVLLDADGTVVGDADCCRRWSSHQQLSGEQGQHAHGCHLKRGAAGSHCLLSLGRSRAS